MFSKVYREVYCGNNTILMSFIVFSYNIKIKIIIPQKELCQTSQKKLLFKYISKDAKSSQLIAYIKTTKKKKKKFSINYQVND